jgi:MSHA biogenesis protein MshJ
MNERLKIMLAKVDGLSLRERAMIFAAAAFTVVSLMNTFFLNPLLAQQKRLSSQVVQQQEKMKETQAQLAALIQAKQADEHAPQREHIKTLRRQLAEGDTFLKSTQDKLVPPEKMALLLEQVLNKNTHLQLMALNTLPVTLFIEPAADTAMATSLEKQIFKHGVQMTVRGNYADLMQYLTALEKMPTQMFWGMAKLSVIQYPNAELTLTLYTLSLDKTWLQV